MKLITIVGARPQFIKAAALSRAIARHNASDSRPQIAERIVHTGQHFDDNMSEVFFREMQIPAPAHHLGIGGDAHGRMTGRMLEAIESVLQQEQPNWVLVFGDTNSTLAGALAAVKMHIPVAHVEAGLRSFNRRMPEEINRILTDHAADLLLAPTDVAMRNLRAEGVPPERIEQVGDIMFDAMLHYKAIALQQSTILRTLALQEKRFILATVHRAENTDDPSRLAGILEGLSRLGRRLPVVVPLHPRTRKVLASSKSLSRSLDGLTILDPVGYLDMLMLASSASLIATDSGGLQKEAYFNGVPCLTLRDETEWTELIHAGANILVGANADRIEHAGLQSIGMAIRGDRLYGDGHTAERIIASLRAHALTKHSTHVNSPPSVDNAGLQPAGRRG
jgi:UDP-GlcNAc3NAcA epimerase